MLGVYDIPASTTTISLAGQRITDANLGAQYSFASRAEVEALTQAISTLLDELPGTPDALLTDLAAYWQLDEASGGRADSIGGNDLTDTNTVTQAAGKIDTAAHFTAANNESLSIADNAALSMGDDDFTLAAWVYLDSKGPNNQIIMIRARSPVRPRTSMPCITVSSKISSSCAFRTAGQSGRRRPDAFGSPPTSAWCYVVA